jgi:WD40 repeat protein
VTRLVFASTLSALLATSLLPALADDAPRGRDLTKGSGPAKVAFAPDGKTLATGSSREVKLWDPTTGKLIRALAGHELPVRAVAFAPDDRSLATAAGDNRDGKLTGEVKVWDAMTGERRHTLTVESSDVNALAFSPDGRLLVAGGHRGLWIWDVAGGDLKHRAPSSAAVLAITFAPDGGSLASGAFDQSARVWDPKTWAERRVLKGHRSEVRALAFAPDGKTLATGGVGEVIIWNAGTGEKVRSLNAGATVWALAFSPDGKTLATGVGDPKAGGEGGVQIWDASTGERLRTWTGRGGSVLSLAFTDEGKKLATGRYDGTVTVWALAGK